MRFGDRLYDHVHNGATTTWRCIVFNHRFRVVPDRYARTEACSRPGCSYERWNDAA